MLSYLSEEWARAVDRALQGHPGLEAATRDTSLVVQTIVTGTHDGTTAYAVTLEHGSNHVHLGRHEAPDVSFECDQRTAVAIATGRESAQSAFMAGRLRIGGDARRLMHHQAVLTELDDVFAAVRADTAWPTDEDA